MKNEKENKETEGNPSNHKAQEVLSELEQLQKLYADMQRRGINRISQLEIMIANLSR